MAQIITYKGLDQYLKPVIDDLGCQVQVLVTKERAQEFLNEETIAVLPLDQFLRLDSYPGVIVIAENLDQLSQPKREELKKLCFEEKYCGNAVIDLSRDSYFYKPLLKTFVRNDSLEYRELMSKSIAELQRIKRLHEKLVPLRNQKIKGMQVFSKYIAGESSGGEFFDFIGDDKDYYFFVVSSSSYLATSHTISQFEFLTGRGQIDLDAQGLFLDQLLAQVNSFDIPDLEFDVLLAHIDLKKLRIVGHNIGNGIILSDGSNVSIGRSYSGNLEDNFFDWHFSRGEKVVILSPGVNKNCGGFIDGQKMNDYILNRIDLGPVELLNELFFQLKRGASSTFLKYDASAIYIEVDKNVFIEI